MPMIQHIKDKDAVLVPVKDWEKMQKELIRLRRKVNKEKLLREMRNTIVEIETDIKNGVEPKGRDAHEFLAELMNEK
jgi:DNA polymerase III delta subunit